MKDPIYFVHRLTHRYTDKQTHGYMYRETDRLIPEYSQNHSFCGGIMTNMNPQKEIGHARNKTIDLLGPYSLTILNNVPPLVLQLFSKFRSI